MKQTKQIIAFLLLLTCASSLSAYATTKSTDTRIYSSKSHPALMKGVQGAYDETDIWVHNRSDYVVWTDVPGWGIHDELYPNETDTIYSASYYPYVHIVLTTLDGEVFFDADVPNGDDVYVDNGYQLQGQATSSGKVKPHVTLKKHIS